jgi:hypothetical protein
MKELKNGEAAAYGSGEGYDRRYWKEQYSAERVRAANEQSSS